MKIENSGVMQTYSKFQGCLDLQHSNFQRYWDHQCLSQYKYTVLHCLSLQNSSQQLIKRSFIKDCNHSILSITKLVHILIVLCILKQWFERQVFHTKHIQTKTLIHLYIITE